MSDVPTPDLGSTAIISEEAADLLKKAGEGTLGNNTGQRTGSEGQQNDKKSDYLQVDQKQEQGSGVSESVTSGITNLDNVDSNENQVSGNTNSNAVVDSFETTKVDGEKEIESSSPQQTVVTSKELHQDKEIDTVDAASEKVDEQFYVTVEPPDSKTDKEIEEKQRESEKDSEGVKNQNKEGERKSEGASSVDELGVESGEHSTCKVVVSVEDEGDIKSDDIEVFHEDINMRSSDKYELDEKCTSLGSELREPRGRANTYGSCISMESDVTYHSESEILDSLDMEGGDVDFTASTCQQTEKPTFEVSSCELTDFQMPSGELFKDVAYTSDGSSMVEMGNTRERISEELDISALVPYLDQDIPGDTGSGESHAKSKLCKQDHAEDEVFLSLKQNLEMSDVINEDSKADLDLFVRNYVKDVLQTSLARYNNEIKDEEMSVRRTSLRSDGIINITVPKRQYSEEILRKATPYFQRSLSAGHVQVFESGRLPCKTEKSDAAVTFLSFQVESDADLVLTSIEEEQKMDELEGKCDTKEQQLPPVSGFGVYYTKSRDCAAVDSDDSDSEESQDMAEMLEETRVDSFQPDFTEALNPEFTAMPVKVETVTVKETEENESLKEDYIMKDPRSKESEKRLNSKDSKSEQENEVDSKENEQEKEDEYNEREEGKENDSCESEQGKDFQSAECEEGSEVQGEGSEQGNNAGKMECQQGMEDEDKVSEQGKAESTEGEQGNKGGDKEVEHRKESISTVSEQGKEAESKESEQDEKPESKKSEQGKEAGDEEGEQRKESICAVSEQGKEAESKESEQGEEPESTESEQGKEAGDKESVCEQGKEGDSKESEQEKKTNIQGNEEGKKNKSEQETGGAQESEQDNKAESEMSEHERMVNRKESEQEQDDSRKGHENAEGGAVKRPESIGGESAQGYESKSLDRKTTKKKSSKRNSKEEGSKKNSKEDCTVS